MKVNWSNTAWEGPDGEEVKQMVGRDQSFQMEDDVVASVLGDPNRGTKTDIRRKQD